MITVDVIAGLSGRLRIKLARARSPGSKVCSRCSGRVVDFEPNQYRVSTVGNHVFLEFRNLNRGRIGRHDYQGRFVYTYGRFRVWRNQVAVHTCQLRSCVGRGSKGWLNECGLR